MIERGDKKKNALCNGWLPPCKIMRFRFSTKIICLKPVTIKKKKNGKREWVGSSFN